MAFDGILVFALANELKNALTLGRIEKIYQPERDEIILVIHGNTGTLRLLISANSNYPRVHITCSQKVNPLTAPMFCMYLRKHLQSGRIIDITTHELERIIIFHIESASELGDIETKRLIVEIMGRHSNIILVNNKDKILACNKYVDITVSRLRQVLPGLSYTLPPPQNKINILKTNETDIRQVFENSPHSGRIDKFILSAFAGFSPLISRELTFEALGSSDEYFENLDFGGRDKLIKALIGFAGKILKMKFTPVIIKDAHTNVASDFNIFPIHQYENSMINVTKENINLALDEYYSSRDNEEKVKQKSSDMVKLITNHLDRCTKKLYLQEEKLREAAGKDKLRLYGDLILGYIYLINDQMDMVDVYNFYSADNEKVTIPLEKGISPAKNAQLYFIKYNKAKNAEKVVSYQMKLNLNEIEYLESISDAIKRAKTLQETEEVREELIGEGYMKSKKKGKKKQEILLPPHEFKSSDGFTIYVGKNNKQNDALTLKSSRADDLWFHTKSIPGAHTVIKTNGNKSIPERTLIEAASLAAYHSKAQNSANVPVDYTFIRNVKKPSGAKPGMVIYDNFHTIYATPTEALAWKLSIKI